MRRWHHLPTLFTPSQIEPLDRTQQRARAPSRTSRTNDRCRSSHPPYRFQYTFYYRGRHPCPTTIRPRSLAKFPKLSTPLSTHPHWQHTILPPPQIRISNQTRPLHCPNPTKHHIRRLARQRTIVIKLKKKRLTKKLSQSLFHNKALLFTLNLNARFLFKFRCHICQFFI